MRKNVEEAYQEVEYTRTMEPYKIYLEALESIFDLSLVKDFADLGCSNARLIEALKRKYTSMNVLGLDYFDWAKEHADSSIKEFIDITDLGKPYSFTKQYDIVNCSEVGEHVEPDYEEILLDNMVKATKDILILTWSNLPSDKNGQHVNPRPQSYIKNKLSEKGLTFWKEATYDLRSYLKLHLEGIGHTWWADNIMVFKKVRFAQVKSRYFIQGINTDNDSHKKELASNSWFSYGYKSLQRDFMDLTSYIQSAVATNRGGSILRASDGDYYFLREIAVGSATPGRRALTKTYQELNTSLFRSLFWHHSLYSINLDSKARGSWRRFILTELPEKISRTVFKRRFKIFEDRYVRYAIDIILKPFTIGGILPFIMATFYSIKRGPLYLNKAQKLNSGMVPSCEAVYALLSTKWILKNYRNEIGIIAGSEKISLVKSLMEYPGYRQYLGIDTFTDYIEVPQKGAADNVEQLATSLYETIKSSNAKIFLVGAGSSKIALIPLLRTYSNALFIDIGAGIDALAGVVCQERPYFAEWTNYRLPNFDYSKVDFMDQGNPAWDNPEYITKKL